MFEWVEYLKLFGGLTYLLIGGDLLVRGAIGLSKRTHISEAVVGLTIVAVGTSAPELFVSVYAALSGSSEIAIGNVVGSNIANVLLVLGVPALIYPIVTNEQSLKSQASYMLAISVLFVALCFYPPLSWTHGVLLLGLLAVGGWLTYRGHASMPGLDEAGDELRRTFGLPGRRWVISLFVILGIVMLPVGADLTVDSAGAIALSLGVSEAVVGCSLIAFGTSLPELSTTVVAAFHRSASIALGNVIGSNVLNILAIMGITTVLADVTVPSTFLAFDLWAMLAVAALLWLVVLISRPITRVAGVGLLALYAGYLGVIYS